MISMRSMVSMSECMYRTRTFMPSRYSVRFSAMRFVKVVTRVRKPFAACLRISPNRSSIWPSTGRTSTSGSTRPVGRMICSATRLARFNSYSAGVAETQSIWGILASNSGNFKGRLSKAEGMRKPYSTKLVFRAKSPRYMAPTWGKVTWDSSTMRRKSSGK